MKKMFTAILPLCFAIAVAAQDTSIIYFSSIWKETTADKAIYKRKKFRQDSGWGVLDYYQSGHVQMKGVYSNDSCTVENGTFNWYADKMGNIVRTSVYRNGKPEGMETFWYENGVKQMEGKYTDGKMEGDWQGWWKSGKLSGKGSFSHGEQVSGEYFNEDGTPNKSVTVFNSAALFPGGAEGLAQYLRVNLHYPKQAVRKKIQGTVVVLFIVGKDGSVEVIKVDQPVDPQLDAEAMRVVQQMPKWTPAIYGGRLSDFYARQPVTFRLE